MIYLKCRTVNHKKYSDIRTLTRYRIRMNKLVLEYDTIIDIDIDRDNHILCYFSKASYNHVKFLHTLQNLELCLNNDLHPEL